MSAKQYRARADALEQSADAPLDYDLVLELRATAAEWRRLAAFADAQDALLAMLAALGDHEPRSGPTS
jgi:hypothetical protein